MTSICIDSITRKPARVQVVAAVNATLAVLTCLLGVSLPLAFVAGIEYIRIYQP